MNTEEIVVMSPDALSRLVTDAVSAALEKVRLYPNNGHQPKMLSWRDITKDYGIARRTLELWRHMGTGPEYLQVGGRILYERVTFERFLAAGRVQPAESLPKRKRATPTGRQ
jgi:hypothetical protein